MMGKTISTIQRCRAGWSFFVFCNCCRSCSTHEQFPQTSFLRLKAAFRKVLLKSSYHHIGDSKHCGLDMSLEFCVQIKRDPRSNTLSERGFFRPCSGRGSLPRSACHLCRTSFASIVAHSIPKGESERKRAKRKKHRFLKQVEQKHIKQCKKEPIKRIISRTSGELPIAYEIMRLNGSVDRRAGSVLAAVPDGQRTSQ